jgi:hypothetical protein
VNGYRSQLSLVSVLPPQPSLSVAPTGPTGDVGGWSLRKAEAASDTSLCGSRDNKAFSVTNNFFFAKEYYNRRTITGCRASPSCWFRGWSSCVRQQSRWYARHGKLLVMRPFSQGTLVSSETGMGSKLRGLKITPPLECDEHYVFRYIDISIFWLHVVRSLTRRPLNFLRLAPTLSRERPCWGPNSDYFPLFSRDALKHQVTRYVTALEWPSLGKGYGRILKMGASPAFDRRSGLVVKNSWLQIQRSRVRFSGLPDFLRSSGSGTGSTQPREDNWGVTWMEK